MGDKERPVQRRGLALSAAVEDIHVNVDVLTTPNEDAVKLMPGCDVTGQVRAVSIRHKDLAAAAGDAAEGGEQDTMLQLARQLFAIRGVKGLLFGYDFVTLQKESDADWDAIQDSAVRIIEKAARIALHGDVPMAPLVGIHAQLRPLQPVLEKDGELVERILELLEEKVIPNVQADGGDVQFRGFADGVVWVSMVGACASCSSSTVTVRFMIKNLLTHYIEEVSDVQSIGEDEDLNLQLAIDPDTKNKPRVYT